MDSFSFVIRTKTKQNKDKKEGGETFEVKIVHEGDKEEVKNVNIKDIGDGTYLFFSTYYYKYIIILLQMIDILCHTTCPRMETTR